MAIVKIKTANTGLTLDSLSTLLTSDQASGSSTLTVKNITGFAVNQVLVLGTFGNQGCEIIKTHASTAPTGSTITLASNTVFPHSNSSSVTIINYDQIEISTATTTTGSKSVLTTTNIIADSLTTNYNDTANSTGYYFARFKNSITSVFSSYSDPIPVTGYTPLTARSIIDKALGSINKTTSSIFSDEFAFQQLDNCGEEVLRELKRWSFMQVFDFSLGTLSTGSWSISLPTDIDDANSTKSIYNFRIGTDDNLTWVDKEKWNEIISGISYTTLANSISVSDATIILTDSANFNSTGTVQIGANTYTYTANNKTTGVLTLSTVSTTTNTSGTNVFSGASYGDPTYWTTYGGLAYFYPVLTSTYTGMEAKMDYYKKYTQITTDTQTVAFPDPTVAEYYLCWKFMLRQNNGVHDESTNVWKAEYTERKNKMIQKESINRTFNLRPRLNQVRIDRTDSRATRLGNFNLPS